MKTETQTALLAVTLCNVSPYKASIVMLQTVGIAAIVRDERTIPAFINENPDPVLRHNMRQNLARLIAYIGGNVNE